MAGAAPDATDDYGAVWNLTPADLSAPVTVSVSVGGTPDVIDQAFTPTGIPAAWLQPGEQVLYPSRGAAEDVATIHYHRPDGDYGDPTSSDFNDFWGLHTWTGSASPTGTSETMTRSSRVRGSTSPSVGDISFVSHWFPCHREESNL